MGFPLLFFFFLGQGRSGWRVMRYLVNGSGFLESLTHVWRMTMTTSGSDRLVVGTLDSLANRLVSDVEPQLSHFVSTITRYRPTATLITSNLHILFLSGAAAAHHYPPLFVKHYWFRKTNLSCRNWSEFINSPFKVTNPSTKAPCEMYFPKTNYASNYIVIVWLFYCS